MNLHLMAEIAMMSSMLLIRLRHSMTTAVHRVHRHRGEAAATRADIYARKLLRSMDFDRSRRKMSTTSAPARHRRD